MQHEIHRNDIDTSPSLEKAIQHKIDKIHTRLKRYHPDAAHLFATLVGCEQMGDLMLETLENAGERHSALCRDRGSLEAEIAAVEQQIEKIQSDG